MQLCCNFSLYLELSNKVLLFLISVFQVTLQPPSFNPLSLSPGCHVTPVTGQWRSSSTMMSLSLCHSASSCCQHSPCGIAPCAISSYHIWTQLCRGLQETDTRSNSDMYNSSSLKNIVFDYKAAFIFFISALRSANMQPIVANHSLCVFRARLNNQQSESDLVPRQHRQLIMLMLSWTWPVVINRKDYLYCIINIAYRGWLRCIYCLTINEDECIY